MKQNITIPMELALKRIEYLLDDWSCWPDMKKDILNRFKNTKIPPLSEKNKANKK